MVTYVVFSIVSYQTKLMYNEINHSEHHMNHNANTYELLVISENNT